MSLETYSPLSAQGPSLPEQARPSQTEPPIPNQQLTNRRLEVIRRMAQIQTRLQMQEATGQTVQGEEQTRQALKKVRDLIVQNEAELKELQNKLTTANATNSSLRWYEFSGQASTKDEIAKLSAKIIQVTADLANYQSQVKSLDEQLLHSQGLIPENNNKAQLMVELGTLRQELSGLNRQLNLN